jgi:DNA modification methylase
MVVDAASPTNKQETNRMNPRNSVELKIDPIKTTDLKANSRNARTHSKKQVAAIAESIKAFGFTNPILIDDDGVILAGHGRFAAAKVLGLDQVPAIRLSELSEPQKRAYVLADNKLAERAGWDRELLTVELGELAIMLPDVGLSVELTGFEIGEIDALAVDGEENNAASKDDDVVPVPDPVSQTGDLWLLGQHRLLCGDARQSDVLARLVDSDPVDMVFTDPPYNVSIDGTVLREKRHQHGEFAMASGEMSETEFTDFLHEVLGNAAGISRDGAVHYVCMDWRHIGELITAGKTIYSQMLNLCVWHKSNWGMGNLYRSQHELVAVFKVGGEPEVNNVDRGKFGRSRSNVWHYAGVNTFKAGRQEELASHPTVKPVALVADAIKDVTKRRAIILDMFGGSGTTLIAAERTGRRARLMEIEPRYVDVTVTRYERLTKADAVHAETGQTYAEVAAQRRATSH